MIAVDVLIVGGGPAGLTAAAGLRGHTVVVVERERQAGGIPRHSDHPGYGWRDLRRVMSGPDYARRLVDNAVTAGADIRTETMVTGWDAQGDAELTSPAGRFTLSAKVILLATGARERPRSARLVAGDRPRGVYTTGELQNTVHVHHRPVGTRAVVVGAELVSWSAVLTLRSAGVSTALMVTRQPRPDSYAAVAAAGRLALGVPVRTRTRVVRIVGRGHVEGVEIEDVETGARDIVECDTVVFTGDWIADNELARAAGVDLDPATTGPLVDTAFRTSRDGLFAAGNLVHPVDTADVAALDGRFVAGRVADWLAGDRPNPGSVRLRATDPFRWVAPGRLRAGDARRTRLLLWSDELVIAPRVALVQDGHRLARLPLPWPAAPGRAFRVPARVLRDVNPAGGDVWIGLD